MKRTSLALAAALLVAAAGCQKPGPGAVDAKRLTAAEGGADWLAVGQGYGERHFSPLKAIDAANVGKLGLAWSRQFDTDRGQEATPVVVDGVLYTSTAWSKVYAFDAATGALKWAFDPKVDGAKAFDACCDVVNRGVAVWKGRVYVGALDGRLIALDAATGKQAWAVQTTDTSRPYTITGAPRVVKDKVLIGNGGAEYGVRGYVSAYDAASGELAWRFFTTPNPDGKPDGAASDRIMAQKAAATWSDGVWKQSGGGGTVWDGMAYDPVLDIVYIGVGNGAPWNHRLRSGGKGDNLFLASILALKPDTGEYVWHYQTTPAETWDYTATQPMVLADLTIGGRPRKVLMQAPKNGFFYVLDRADGRLISAEPFVGVTWASGVDRVTGRPIEDPKARFRNAPSQQLPWGGGGHSWHPMAFSPATGLVYIPTQSVPMTYGDDAKFAYRPGAMNTGVRFDAALTPQSLQAPPDLRKASGALLAWDPVAQKARWSVPRPAPINGGVLATGGALVFQGDAQGEFAAYDAASGRKLWAVQTGNGILAAPMTYAIEDQQYVALMVGAGGGLMGAGRHARAPGRLLVFKLNGTAVLPPLKDSDQLPPLDVTGVTSAGDAVHGAQVFQANCIACHGANASASWLADLKRSPMLLTQADWKSVVIDGARSSRGMASFRRFLTERDADDVRAFVLSVAKQPAAAAPALGLIPDTPAAAKGGT